MNAQAGRILNRRPGNGDVDEAIVGRRPAQAPEDRGRMVAERSAGADGEEGSRLVGQGNVNKGPDGEDTGVDPLVAGPRDGGFRAGTEQPDHPGSFCPGLRGKTSQVSGTGLSWLDYPHGGAVG